MVTKLIQGHRQFRADYFEHERELFDSLARGGQRPIAMFIGCCDARVVPNLIVNADPGDLFVLRNIGNIVPRFEDGQVHNRSVGAAIEYAVHVLEVPHLVVCGHTQCGGLRALIDGLEHLPAETPTLANWLRDAAAVLGRLRGELEPDAIWRQLVFENVVVQLDNLLTYPTAARALEAKRLEIHGWVYDVADGSLRVYDPEHDEFRPLDRGGP
jgi:carbonic anhydrase